MRLWDADGWSNYCKTRDHARVKVALGGRGFTVGGFVNGRPQLGENVDWQKIQSIVADCLAGKTVQKPSLRQTESPAAKEEAPKAKSVTKKPAGAKK